MTNLLQNPGFETEWSDDGGGHLCAVFKPDDLQ